MLTRGRVVWTFCVLALLGCSVVVAAGSTQAASEPARTTAKFEPPDGRVLVFVGQDNESVGGSEKWGDGYVDHFGVPAGVTHYVYFSEGKENPYGGVFDEGSVDGLNAETEWAAGPMCMRCYLESTQLANTIVHLSISMEHDDEPAVAAGDYDHNIDELVAFVAEFRNVPFLIRIGYEFDGEWNSYEPEAFKAAWRRIVDALRAEGLDNFATVLATYRLDIPDSAWEEYWPGDDYVDWLGYSYWGGGTSSTKALDFARARGKPIFIAESTPRGHWIDREGDAIWEAWFADYLLHIEENADVIKAISYINADWDSQAMWAGRGWGNTRIQDDDAVAMRWRETMGQDLYVHDVDGTYDLIGFPPGSR